jgi:hypothetical protein
MKLYALALFVASCMSFSFLAGKLVKDSDAIEPIAAQNPSQIPDEGEPRSRLRVVAVSATPDPSTAAIFIQYPKQGAMLNGNPVWVQVRVEGYPLGNDSEFDRSSEIFDSSMGQTVRVIIDNQPYFPINGPSIQPFNEDGFYYDQSFKFQIPQTLKEGFHTIRVFPARSFGESLKGERTFQASYFYVGNKTDEHIDWLSKPYLTYNEPSEQSSYTENRPILLDFYLSNCDLSPDGYRVRLSIDGQGARTISAWQPYYLYGLSKGRHTIRLELIDAKGKVVSGPFNDNTRKIIVH